MPYSEREWASYACHQCRDCGHADVSHRDLTGACDAPECRCEAFLAVVKPWPERFDVSKAQAIAAHLRQMVPQAALVDAAYLQLAADLLELACSDLPATEWLASKPIYLKRGD